MDKVTPEVEPIPGGILNQATKAANTVKEKANNVTKKVNSVKNAVGGKRRTRKISH